MRSAVLVLADLKLNFKSANNSAAQPALTLKPSPAREAAEKLNNREVTRKITRKKREAFLDIIQKSVRFRFVYDNLRLKHSFNLLL